MSKYCANCGNPLDELSKYCLSCGSQVAPDNGPADPGYYSNTEYQSRDGNLAPVMGIGSYIGTMILFAIPLVGFILMLVWGFGSGANPNKKNFSLAMLVVNVAVFVLVILLVVAGGAAFLDIVNEFESFY